MHKTLLLVTLTATLALGPTLSVAAEPSLTTRHQLDATIAKYFPQSKPCALWEGEHLDLRCTCVSRPGTIQIRNMHYIAVSVANDGLTIIQDDDWVYVIPSDAP